MADLLPGTRGVSDSGDPTGYQVLKQFFDERGVISSADAQARLGRDATVVRPLLQRLVQERLAVPEGRGRGLRYRRYGSTAYRTQSMDTTPEVERLLFDAYRRMASWEKVRRVSESTRACQELALAGMRERHPGASERELELRLAALRLDCETMIRVYGWDPAQTGH